MIFACLQTKGGHAKTIGQKRMHCNIKYMPTGSSDEITSPLSSSNLFKKTCNNFSRLSCWWVYGSITGKCYPESTILDKQSLMFKNRIVFSEGRKIISTQQSGGMKTIGIIVMK